MKGEEGVREEGRYEKKRRYEKKMKEQKGK